MATDRVILCGGAAAGGLPFPDRCPVRLGRPDEAGSNTRLRIDDVSHAMSRAVPPAFLDLLDIAAYVYVADQAVRRGSPSAVDLGDSWHRRLFFRVPVRDPDFWAGDGPRAALTELLSFLSDDEHLFEFTPRPADPRGITPYLAFEDSPPGGDFDEVMLFSGGLDSLAGAVDEAVTGGRRVLLVHHRSNEKLARRHAALLDLLRGRSARRPGHVVVHANKAEGLNHEFTQRTRSFLFAALGATAAVMAGRDRVRFYENGVTSLNLPPLAQVVGGRASRTTHPRTIRGMSRLLTAVNGKPFTVESPFEWLTKADVVGRITAAGCGEWVGRSTSCGHTWAQSNAHTHCGVCSQCIDRRFAVLAAGAAEFDPAGAYRTDLTTGAWDDDADRPLLLGYVSTARRMERMSHPEFYATFGEAARALRHYGVAPAEAAARVFELHQRHARGVCRAVERAIERNAGPLFRNELSPNCLVALAVNSGSPPDPPAVAPPAADNLFRRRGPGWEVRFQGGEMLVFPAHRGLAYLHILISNAGHPHRVDELACLVDRDRPRYGLGNAGEVIDDTAMSNYRVRFEQLDRDLDDARETGAADREARILHEMDFLGREIGTSRGLGGQVRKAADEFEKVRKAVGAAITRAVELIGDYDRDLAEHFKRPVLTCGGSPRYCPSKTITWET